jgi:hypothetical protein
MTKTQADMLIFLFTTFDLAVIVVGWVVIDFLRRILDAERTLIAQGSKRRMWSKQEHEQ